MPKPFQGLSHSSFSSSSQWWRCFWILGSGVHVLQDCCPALLCLLHFDRYWWLVRVTAHQQPHRATRKMHSHPWIKMYQNKHMKGKQVSFCSTKRPHFNLFPHFDRFSHPVMRLSLLQYYPESRDRLCQLAPLTLDNDDDGHGWALIKITFPAAVPHYTHGLDMTDTWLRMWLRQ